MAMKTEVKQRFRALVNFGKNDLYLYQYLSIRNEKVGTYGAICLSIENYIFFTITSNVFSPPLCPPRLGGVQRGSTELPGRNSRHRLHHVIRPSL